MKRLLLVEDNEMIIKGLTYALTQEQFEVQVCKTAREAESLTGSVVFDIAILDISLPDGNGYDICRHLKEIFPDLPIIFLTAKDEETDVVAGFDAGADDYIIKPFRNRELLSRINNALRRYKKSGTLLTSGALSLDPDAERVFRDGVEIPLTALEYRIVSYLFQNQGQTITRDQLLSRIWDLSGNIVNDNTLTVSITRIREKMGIDAITTVKGLGYRIEKGDA